MDTKCFVKKYSDLLAKSYGNVELTDWELKRMINDYCAYEEEIKDKNI